jgi:hypothetical protein
MYSTQLKEEKEKLAYTKYSKTLATLHMPARGIIQEGEEEKVLQRNQEGKVFGM